MTTPIRIQHIVERDGEIHLTGLPVKVGEQVAVVVQVEAQLEPDDRRPLTARALLDSGLVGLWADRTDIGDSLEFAHALRAAAEQRR